MSSRSGKKVVVATIDPAKLERIKAGTKQVNVTGVKEKTKNISHKDGSQFLAIEKEKKFEEAGVTRKKRNFVMYESKLGTETDRDLLKLQGAKKNKPRPKPQNIEETIISKYKRKEYLDNFQYHETKELKKKPPAIVVHNRMSDPITGAVVEYSYTQTSNSVGKNRGANRDGKTSTTTKTILKETKSTGNLRNRPKAGGSTSATATKSIESTTKIGRRGGAGGAQSSTTTTRTEKKTTRTRSRK